MQINLTGRHMEITDSMRQYCEDKLGKLPRFYDRLSRLEAIVTLEGGRHELEVVAHADHKNTFVAQIQADEFYAAVDLIFEKLERQLTKHKETHRNRKHPG